MKPNRGPGASKALGEKKIAADAQQVYKDEGESVILALGEEILTGKKYIGIFLAFLVLVAVAFALVLCQQQPPPKPIYTPNTTSAKPKTFRVELVVTCKDPTIKNMIEDAVTTGLTQIPDVVLVPPTSTHDYLIRIVAAVNECGSDRAVWAAYVFTKTVFCGGHGFVDHYSYMGVRVEGDSTFRDSFKEVATSFNRQVLSPQR